LFIIYVKMDLRELITNSSFDEIKKLISNTNEEEINKILNIACGMGNMGLVEYLFEHKDHLINRNHQDLPTGYALGEGKLDVLEYLVSKGFDLKVYDVISVLRVLEKGHLEVAKYMLFALDISVKDLCSRTNALNRIIEVGHTDIVKYLLDNGADINYDRMDETPHACSTPLAKACVEGDLKIVKLLLSYGADIRIKNNIVMSYALKYGHIDIVECLAEAGAKTSFYKKHYDMVSNHSIIINKLFEKHSFDALSNIIDDIDDECIKKTITKIKLNRQRFFVNLRNINNVSIITY